MQAGMCVLQARLAARGYSARRPEIDASRTNTDCNALAEYQMRAALLCCSGMLASRRTTPSLRAAAVSGAGRVHS